MKTPFLVIGLFFYAGTVCGQEMDSLAVLREVDSLVQLNGILIDKRQPQEAIKVIEAAEKTAFSAFGNIHPAYATCLFQHGKTFFKMRLYDEAEPYYLEALRLRKDILGESHPDYYKNLSSIGSLYSDMGQWMNAEKYFLEAKYIIEKNSGKEHADYTVVVQNLGLLYMQKGEFGKAEICLFEVKQIKEKIYGKVHNEYASILNTIGVLYFEMLEYGKAESYFLEALAIFEQNLGKKHLNYAGSITNLGIFYRKTGQYEKSLARLLEAAEIREEQLGKDHPEYAASLLSVGNVYANLKQNDKAEAHFLEAKEILKKNKFKSALLYSNALNNLGTFYRSLDRFPDSETYLLEARDVRKKNLGIYHPSYSNALENLTKLYFKTGDDQKAKPILLEWNQLNQQAYLSRMVFQSETELSKYAQDNVWKYNVSLSLAKQYAYADLAYLSSAWDQLIFIKGLVLNNTRSFKALLSTTPDSLKNIQNLWQNSQRQLMAEYVKPNPNQKDIREMEQRADSLEKVLVRSLTGFADVRREVRWQDIKSKLAPREAVVEFVHFEFYNSLYESSDSIFYGAFLLLPHDTIPRFFPLFEQRQLEALLPKSDNRAGINTFYNNPALYQLVWASIEKVLSGLKTIYYSPSGLLHRLNIAALRTPATTTLGDRYQFVQLGSTRQLVIPSETAAGTAAATLFGGIQYNMDSVEMARANTTLFAARSGNTRGDATALPEDSTLRGGAWRYLPGTEREVLALEPLLQTAGLSTTLRMDFDASEEVFKAIGQTDGSGSPRVLHLATHGFFFPDPKTAGSQVSSTGSDREPVYRRADNPMLRAGLVLAGANHAWQGNPPLAGMDDGILTAYEISQMNLRNTELVVLSACETGLGDIRGKEGVYGLQRAFKIAGARYLIMSLWKVPDEQTGELMQIFYRKWLVEKQPIPQAFRAAQQDMQTKHPDDPHAWAGFVLVE